MTVLARCHHVSHSSDRPSIRHTTYDVKAHQSKVNSYPLAAVASLLETDTATSVMDTVRRMLGVDETMPTRPCNTDRIVIALCTLGDYVVVFWLDQPKVTNATVHVCTFIVTVLANCHHVLHKHTHTHTHTHTHSPRFCDCQE